MKISGLFLFILTIIVITNNSTAYDFLGVFQNDTTLNLSTIAPSFYWKGTCNVSMQSLISSDPDTLTIAWYSPDSTLVATSLPELTTSATCKNMGNPNALTSLNDYYESKITVNGFQDRESWIKATYSCDPDANDLITYSNTNYLDSHNFYPYEYVLRTGGYCEVGAPTSLPAEATQVNLVLSNMEAGYYTDCGSGLVKGSVNAQPIGCGINRWFGDTWWSFRPFNAGSFGQVNISVTNMDFINNLGVAWATMSCSTNKIYLYNRNLNASSSISSSTPYSESLQLIPNNDYWLLIGAQCIGKAGGGGTSLIGYNSSIYEIIINAFDPNYVIEGTTISCETNTVDGYSSCVNGTQIRTCIDTFGVAPAIIESKACFDVPSIDILLGFEESRTESVYICGREFWLACSPFINITSVKYPKNWSVISTVINGAALENFIRISQDTSTRGSSSLKMNYIPSKPNEPVNTNPVTCNNLTSGRSPEVNHPYNESLFVAQNVSFSSPNVELRWDVKKCSLPPVQYDYTGQAFLGFSCGKLCYSNNCTAEPRGRYGIRLTDNVIIENHTNETFSLYDHNGVNITENVTEANGNLSSSISVNYPPNQGIINSSSNIFVQQTHINTFSKVANANRYMCYYANDSTLLADFLHSDTNLQWDNFTISNSSIYSDSILIRACNTSTSIIYDYISVTTSAVISNSTEIIVDYFSEATTSWQVDNRLDLTNVGLEVNHNYTVAIGINPENVLDPESHCVYFDNFRATYSEQALPECESICDGLDLRKASILPNGVCAFNTFVNAPECQEDQETSDEIQSILDGTSTQNWTCLDEDGDGTKETQAIYDHEQGLWSYIENAPICLEEIEDDASELNLTSAVDSIDDLGFLGIFISPMGLYFIITAFISAVITGISGRFLKGNGNFGVFAILEMIFILLGSLPTVEIIPIWMGAVIILGIIILTAKQVKELFVGD